MRGNSFAESTPSSSPFKRGRERGDGHHCLFLSQSEVDEEESYFATNLFFDEAAERHVIGGPFAMRGAFVQLLFFDLAGDRLAGDGELLSFFRRRLIG